MLQVSVVRVLNAVADIQYDSISDSMAFNRLAVFGWKEEVCLGRRRRCGRLREIKSGMTWLWAGANIEKCNKNVVIIYKTRSTNDSFILTFFMSSRYSFSEKYLARFGSFPLPAHYSACNGDPG